MKHRGKSKAIWTRIGAAWPHNSPTGELEALPVDRRVVHIEPKPEASELPGTRNWAPAAGAAAQLTAGVYEACTTGGLYPRFRRR